MSTDIDRIVEARLTESNPHPSIVFGRRVSPSTIAPLGIAWGESGDRLPHKGSGPAQGMSFLSPGHEFNHHLDAIVALRSPRIKASAKSPHSPQEHLARVRELESSGVTGVETEKSREHRLQFEPSPPRGLWSSHKRHR